MCVHIHYCIHIYIYTCKYVYVGPPADGSPGRHQPTSQKYLEADPSDEAGNHHRAQNQLYIHLIL